MCNEEMRDQKAKLLANIQHALSLIGEQELHGHTSYVVRHMIQELRPSDLTDSEMMAVAIILAHAHARKVGRPKPTTVVPIRRENAAAAADLFPHVLFG